MGKLIDLISENLSKLTFCEDNLQQSLIVKVINYLLSVSQNNQIVMQHVLSLSITGSILHFECKASIKFIIYIVLFSQ